MELIKQLFDLVMHMDVHLDWLVSNYGLWTYLLLFAIIFCETGLVVTPFLPGDSLLFAIGTFAARGSLDLFILLALLCAAAILGDTANYWIGKLAGPKVFRSDTARFLNKKQLLRTHKFYEKYGGITIILARFMPFIRTFAPFVAGIGSMSYGRFLSYNVIGGIMWICLFLFCGYFFGNLPLVKNNFSLVIMMIVIISVLPAAIEYIRERRRKSAAG